MIDQLKKLFLRSPTVQRIAVLLRLTPQPEKHAVKQAVILELAEQFGARTFVETGTFRGDMIAAMAAYFDKLYSIELNAEFCHAAQRRFADDENVEILHGDSGQKLAEILPRLKGPTLFWLDGHFSGGDTARGREDTPVIAELDHILSAPDLGHVILIDDARLFGRDPAYPSVEAVADMVSKRREDVKIDVRHDAIRILPKPVS